MDIILSFTLLVKNNFLPSIDSVLIYSGKSVLTDEPILVGLIFTWII